MKYFSKNNIGRHMSQNIFRFSSINLVNVEKLKLVDDMLLFNYKGTTNKICVSQNKVSSVKQQLVNKGEIDSVEIKDLSNNSFSESTLIADLIKDKFKIIVNNQYQINIIPEYDLPTYGQANQISTQSQKVVQEFQENLNCNAFAQRVYLAEIVDLMKRNLEQIEGEVVNKQMIRLLMEQSLVQNHSFQKQDCQQLDQMLEFLGEKAELLGKEKRELERQLSVKSSRRLQVFLGYLYSQIFLIQYATYVSYSWDILEPIACLVGISDAIIAYSFWLYSHKDYSFDNIHSTISNYKRTSFYRINNSNVLDDIIEVTHLINHLQKERLEHSEDYQKVLLNLQDNHSYFKE